MATLLGDVAAGGTAGEVGGFEFGTYSQSAPWLPAAALTPVAVAAGAPLRVELDSRATIAEWSASYAAADDTTGDRLTAIGGGPVPASFAGPPAGDWVLSVTIVYGEGGSGAYYWHVLAA